MMQGVEKPVGDPIKLQPSRQPPPPSMPTSFLLRIEAEARRASKAWANCVSSSPTRR